MKVKAILGFCPIILFSAVMASADMPADERFQERIGVQESRTDVPTQPTAVEQQREACSWSTRLSAGVPVWFFDKESTKAGGGLYVDVIPCEMPLNFRAGIEARHLTLDSPAALRYAEWPGKDTKITFIRIPFAVEYVYPLAERVDLYLGGGPDLIRTANDISDFTVGAHLAGRVGYELENNVQLALEGGYMWAEVSDGRGNVSLDGAYVLPTVGYRF